MIAGIAFRVVARAGILFGPAAFAQGVPCTGTKPNAHHAPQYHPISSGITHLPKRIKSTPKTRLLQQAISGLIVLRLFVS